MYQTLSVTRTAMCAHSPDASTSPSSSEWVASRSAMRPLERLAAVAEEFVAERRSGGRPCAGPAGLLKGGEQSRGIGLVDIETLGDVRRANRLAAGSEEIENGEASLEGLDDAHGSSPGSGGPR